MRALQVVFAAVVCCSPLLAQVSPPPSRMIDYVLDSGEVSNDGATPDVVYSETVFLGGARWLRLHFDEIVLAGDVFSRQGAFLRLTAHGDGAIQELNAIHCRQWQNRSCYFNGDAIQVEIYAWPGTGPAG